MWTSDGIKLYDGDCRAGDRAATVEEVAAWQAARDAAVPASVRSGQLILALDQVGKLDAVKAVVAAAGGLAADLWLHASQFDRADPLLQQLGQAAGMTSEDIDAVFRLAATK